MVEDTKSYTLLTTLLYLLLVLKPASDQSIVGVLAILRVNTKETTLRCSASMITL